MRTTGHSVEMGQVWRSSDPRRLSAFRIVARTPEHARVLSLYPLVPPPSWGLRWIPLDRFLVTGPKGYTRVS